jgi:ribosome-associated protein
LTVEPGIEIPLREFRFSFSRSAGPGGQNVNKVNTRVTLRWSVQRSQSLPEDLRQRFVARYARRISKDGDLLLTSQRFRDQGRNVADCLEKLRAMLQEVARPPRRRRPTRPSRARVESRLREKRRRSTVKRRRKAVRDED